MCAGRNHRVLWRLIVDAERAGAANMARDVAVLDAVSEGRSPATLRLYGWAPPCLTLGRHQGVDAADLDFCRAEGIDVVRRPTGGRALLHHLELTYAVVAPLGSGPLPRGLQDAYRTTCGALVGAMRRLGVAAELTGGEVNLELPGPRTTVPCFEAPAGGEVVVAGRKLVGSAMRAHGGAILQHGAVVLDWDGRLQAGAMGLADDSRLRPHVTTLAAELGRAVARAEVEAAVTAAFADELLVSLEPSRLTADEERRARELAPSFRIDG
jgi:lipoate-protein ligase A